MNPKTINIGDKLVWLDPDNLYSQVVTVTLVDNPIIGVDANEDCESTVFDSELHTLESINCCEICGNIDIEKTAWVYANNGVLSNNTDVTSFWCPNCDRGGIKSKSVKQYLDDTNNK